MTVPTLGRAIPILRVTDAVRAEAFYCEKLGFVRRFVYRIEPARQDPCYLGLVRDQALVHVSSFPGDGVVGSAVVLPVDDVDALFAELRAKGVAIDLEPVDQSWGNREMYLRDPDGNTLRFTREGPV